MAEKIFKITSCVCEKQLFWWHATQWETTKGRKLGNKRYLLKKRDTAEACTYLCPFVRIQSHSRIGSDASFLAGLSISLAVYFSSFHFSFNRLKKK